MAVEWQLDEEDEEEQSSGSGQEIAGAPAVVAGADQPSDSPGTSSGSYTNLQKYIEANKGRDFGGQVAGKIEGETQEGLNKLGAAEQQFRSDVDANTINFSDDLRQKISDAPEALTSEDRQMAQRVRTGSYAGPSDFSGGVDNDQYSELRKQFGGLEETKRSLESPGGKRGLLEKYYGRPTYTEGEKSLDEYLLGGGKTALEGAANRAGDAISQYGTKKDELNQRARSAKQTSDLAKQQYGQLLGLDSSGNIASYQRGSGQSGLIQQDLERLNNRAADISNKQSSIINKAKGLRGADKNINLASPDADIYGNLGGVDSLYGVDPSKYLRANQVDYQRAATQQDLARMAALTQLAGAEQNYIDPSLVGSVNDSNSVSFDEQGFQNAVNANKSLYDSELYGTPSYVPGFQGTLGGLIDSREDIYNQYKNSQLSNEFLFQNNIINPYETLLKNREDLRNKYGYYDLIRR